MNRKYLAALLLGLLGLAVQAQENSPTLQKIAASGTIYLGHNEASVPFSYVLPGQETPAGYSWDICGKVVQALAAKLGKPLTVVPVVATSNTRLMLVKTGMANIECGATTNTVARQKQVAFSTTFFVSEVKAMVRAGSGIGSLADLANKRVVTTSGTTADRLIKQAALQRGMVIQHLMGRSHAESMGMMARGEVDAYVADDAILAGQRAGAADPAQLVLLDESLSVEPYGLVLPAGDLPFKQLVDATLVGLMKSGEMEALYAKWFAQPIPPSGRSLNLPLSEINKASFQFPSDRPGN